MEELGTRRKGGRVNREQTSQTRRKAKPLLTEKENEIKMKIDEAERKGDSFHQQVCQMKLGDKSCGRRSRGARVGLWPAPHTCLGSLGTSGCGRGPAGGLFAPLTAVGMACRSSAPPSGLPFHSFPGFPGSPPQGPRPLPQQCGQACKEHFSEAPSSLLCPSPRFPEARSGGSRGHRAGSGWV